MAGAEDFTAGGGDAGTDVPGAVAPDAVVPEADEMELEPAEEPVVLTDEEKALVAELETEYPIGSVVERPEDNGIVDGVFPVNTRVEITKPGSKFSDESMKQQVAEEDFSWLGEMKPIPDGSLGEVVAHVSHPKRDDLTVHVVKLDGFQRENVVLMHPDGLRLGAWKGQLCLICNIGAKFVHTEGNFMSVFTKNVVREEEWAATYEVSGKHRFARVLMSIEHPTRKTVPRSSRPYPPVWLLRMENGWRGWNAPKPGKYVLMQSNGFCDARSAPEALRPRPKPEGEQPTGLKRPADGPPAHPMVRPTKVAPGAPAYPRGGQVLSTRPGIPLPQAPGRAVAQQRPQQAWGGKGQHQQWGRPQPQAWAPQHHQQHWGGQWGQPAGGWGGKGGQMRPTGWQGGKGGSVPVRLPLPQQMGAKGSARAPYRPAQQQPLPLPGAGRGGIGATPSAAPAAAAPGATATATGGANANAGLPPDWSALLDPKTNKYYYRNLKTNAVQWDRPTAGSLATAEQANAGLPAGWTAVLDPGTRRYYYQNTVTDSVQWDKPTVAAGGPGGVVSAAKASEGLPADWEAVLDPKSWKYYYRNIRDNKVQWDRPK